MIRSILTATLAVFLAQPATAQTYRDRSVPMQVVETLDLSRYYGKWYEYARFPNRFEKDCINVTAEYAPRSDGKVQVINTCDKDSGSRGIDKIEGQASVVAPGKLSVTFVPWLPFAKGDYWVLYVEPDYSMAVVGEPKGKTGWILSRKPTLDAARRDRALAVLVANGYDISQLYYVPQR